jgi:hypothetical protein
MQTANVEILINGDMLNTVPKRITAAEVPILRSIHGNDSIVRFREFEDSDVKESEEIERLISVYGKIVREIYQGPVPRLVTAFSEVGIAGGEAPAPVVEKKSKLLKDN